MSREVPESDSGMQPFPQSPRPEWERRITRRRCTVPQADASGRRPMGGEHGQTATRLPSDRPAGRLSISVLRWGGRRNCSAGRAGIRIARDRLSICGRLSRDQGRGPTCQASSGRSRPRWVRLGSCSCEASTAGPRRGLRWISRCCRSMVQNRHSSRRDLRAVRQALAVDATTWRLRAGVMSGSLGRSLASHESGDEQLC